MFKLYFNYYGCDLSVKNCFGLSFSPAGRIMYVKVKKNDRIVTESYYTRDVSNLMFAWES